MLRALTDAFLFTFLSPICVACHERLAAPTLGPVCAACWQDVHPLRPPLCARCGDRLRGISHDGLCDRCRGRTPITSLARSAGAYEGALRAIIHAFKYDGRRALAPPLAALMRAAGADVLSGADAVIPVPLHPFRRWKRGFNQADDLARALGPPVWPVLRRTRHGPPQASLPAARRRANVSRAYALRVRAAPRLSGRSVVLIDDVMTTGETMEACARVLVRAGARRVSALTAARAAAALPARPRR
jgi:ComF family protein